MHVYFYKFHWCTYIFTSESYVLCPQLFFLLTLESLSICHVVDFGLLVWFLYFGSCPFSIESHWDSRPRALPKAWVVCPSLLAIQEEWMCQCFSPVTTVSICQCLCFFLLSVYTHMCTNIHMHSFLPIGMCLLHLVEKNRITFPIPAAM